MPDEGQPKTMGSNVLKRPLARERRNGPGEPADVVTQNVATIAALEETALAQRSASERLADRISRTVGTSWFALFHIGWFGVWLLVNMGWVPVLPVFDPFPFNFLTLMVSLEAIFLSIFVLVSQNRLTRQADRRTHLDLQINLLAEQESTRTIELLERIADHLKVPLASAPNEGELAKPTNIQDVVTTLERALPTD
jgi:uncharacterized membrane protein